MKKLILAFLFVLCLPIYCFGFEIKDLADYSGVAVKTFTERDSLYGKHSNNRIMGSQSFVGLFGSAEATFETEYVYIGDNQITEYGDIEWKYDALITAKDRGAKIRVITDRLQSKGKYSLVSKLIDAGIAVKTNVKHKIMHHKFAIFDGKNIENGSYNWTESASKSNAENCTFFQQSSNKVFTNQFNYLWNLY